MEKRSLNLPFQRESFWKERLSSSVTKHTIAAMLKNANHLVHVCVPPQVHTDTVLHVRSFTGGVQIKVIPMYKNLTGTVGSELHPKFSNRIMSRRNSLQSFKDTK